MRDVLSDIVKQSIGLIEVVKITGTDTDTRVQGCDKEKTVFIEGNLSSAVSDFKGEFGLTNLALLRGLLDFTTYRTEAATFSVKRRAHQGSETVEAFEFRDGKGAGADFRCMSPERVPEQAEIKNIPWDVSFVPNKGKVAEFQQLSSLYSEISKNFGVEIKNGNLLFSFGGEGSSMHTGSMVFEENVQGELNAGLQWPAARFLQVLKLAGGEPTVRVTKRGVLAIEVTTETGTYKYYLRAIR